MSNVLVLSGPNHRFNESAGVIHEFLVDQPDINATLSEDKDLLTAPELSDFGCLVFGTGFTRARRLEDGSTLREPDLTPEQEEGLFRYVETGGGLVGIHGTAWWIGGRAVTLVGGHANWHPPGLTFTVHIDDGDHPVTDGLADFEVEDEIYISAYEPTLHVLASAEWHGRAHPMAWVKPYGEGRVFYTALGHGPNTFERPAMQTLIRNGVRWASAA